MIDYSPMFVLFNFVLTKKYILFSIIIDDETIWDELFLLWANTNELEELVFALNGQQLLERKTILNEFTRRCLTVIGRDNDLQTVNAIQVS